jgi:2-methylfumaryl-CoA hydratase
MITFTPTKQAELAPTIAFTADLVSAPRYGRSLEDFIPGQVFVHPRGQTIDRSQARIFATTFHQANPLYINAEYATDMGFADSPASPQHVFNVVLSLGVQNDSEKAIANLGYYDARFLRPVYPGDTLRALTRVIDRRDRGVGKPGIATIRTLGINQRDEVVLQYQRKIMVPRATAGALPEGVATPAPFPWQDLPVVQLPALMEPTRPGLTDGALYAEDFVPGQVILHFAGRTITDEHMAWSYGVGNTHPLHSDQVYSQGLSGAMSGKPIVYGGLAFAWLEGLASRDVTANAIWDLGFHEGYHTQPVVSGDTLAAITRVLAIEDAPGDTTASLVTLQLIGVKNLSAKAALELHGADLFIKETAKKSLGKEKIPAKVFEIERQLLIRSRG